MKMRKVFSSVLLLVLSLVVCAAAAASAVEKDVEEHVIRVASHGAYPPFTIYDGATKEWSGFEIDMWRAIGERAGYEIQFVQLDIAASFAEMDIDRVDAVAQSISITPIRQQKYDFTQPYFFSPYCLVVAESNNEVKSWKDMEGKTLGLREGHAMNEFIAALDPEDKVKKSIYEIGNLALQDVSLGRITAFPYAYFVLPHVLKKDPKLKLKAVDVENPLYVEVNAYPFLRTEKGKKFLKLTDEALTQMFEDGSYAKLCEKWFGMNVMDSKYAKEYREKQGENQGK